MELISPSQQNYCSRDRELLSGYEAVKYFKCKIEGCRLFKLTTNHLLILLTRNPIKHIQNNYTLSKLQWSVFNRFYPYTYLETTI